MNNNELQSIIEKQKEALKSTPNQGSETSSQQEPLKGFEQKTTESVGEKLDRLYDVMNHIRWIGDKTTFAKLDYICKTLNHIRWIGLSIGCMFALTFIVPQCTGG